jgi:hypothetical protein
MVMLLKNVQLWQAVHYILILKIKLKYAVELSRNTVTRRGEYMSYNTEQLRQYLEICEFVTFR